MIFVHDNTESMAWSLNAKDLLLQGISGSDVTFTVQLDGETVTTFNLVPYDGKIRISLRDLLEAILPQDTDINPMTQGLAVRSGHQLLVSALDNLGASTSVSLTCFRGGIDENAGNSKSTQWLSWKPQVSPTYAWGRELLSLLLMPGYPSSQVAVTIYYLYHSPEIVTLANAPSLVDNKPCIWTYDCSFETIAALASHAEDDSILAYDITMGALPRRRFILSLPDNRAREFIFANSMGVLDTLFTTGELSSGAESSTSVSLIGHNEKEVANAFVAKLKASTGLLQHEREIANLYDFLRSTERYVLAPDDIARRIVVDSIETDISFGRESGATFTYHLADGFTGRHYEDKNLGEYEFTSAE